MRSSFCGWYLYLKNSASDLRNIKYVMITRDKKSFLMFVFGRFKRPAAQKEKKINGTMNITMNHK